jgi:hypothetical protein
MQMTQSAPAATNISAIDDNADKENDGATSKEKVPPKRRLTPGEVRKIIVSNDLDTDLKLCAFAKKMEDEGMPEIIRWVDSHPRQQNRVDVINTAFKLHTAEKQLAEQTSIKVSN